MLLLAEGVSMGVATKLKCPLLRYSKFSTAGKCMLKRLTPSYDDVRRHPAGANTITMTTHVVIIAVKRLNNLPNFVVKLN